MPPPSLPQDRLPVRGVKEPVSGRGEFCGGGEVVSRILDSSLVSIDTFVFVPKFGGRKPRPRAQERLDAIRRVSNVSIPAGVAHL